MDKAPRTVKPSDINLTPVIEHALKARMASRGMTDQEWNELPGHVKETMGRELVPFLWHALPELLSQVNALMSAQNGTGLNDAGLNVPDTLEGLV